MPKSGWSSVSQACLRVGSAVRGKHVWKTSMSECKQGHCQSVTLCNRLQATRSDWLSKVKSWHMLFIS